MITTTKNKQMSFSSPLWYILIVGGTMVLGFASGFLSGSNMGYSGYTRPTLTPSDQAFGIIWPVLYFMIGNSMYFMLTAEKTFRNKNIFYASVIMWLIQLALNLFWPFLFFTLDLKTLAFIEITLLDVSVLAVIILDFMYSKPAAWLMIPYFVWIAFATYLNIFIALYN